jgi:hypothetical protein
MSSSIIWLEDLMRLLATFVLGALAATGVPATNTIWIGKVETLSN